jgi:hypothetical protein
VLAADGTIDRWGLANPGRGRVDFYQVALGRGNLAKKGDGAETLRCRLSPLATRDVCRAVVVLDRLAVGSATTPELRRAAGHPGDSFRSLLRRMQRAGLIACIATPGRPCRWSLAGRIRCHADREAIAA